MYTVIIAPSAQNELKKISKNYREAIKEAIKEIKEYPSIGKPLSKELTGKFSYRMGIYRIIYSVDQKDKTILVSSAGHRESIYIPLRNQNAKMYNT